MGGWKKNKVITWQSPYFNKNFKEPTHRATRIEVNSETSMVRIVIEKGVSVESIELSMETCEDIGFINFSKLEDYCK